MRHADLIYIFENGRIIEQGSHDMHMKMNGKYAEMFKVQAEKYINNAWLLLRNMIIDICGDSFFVNRQLLGSFFA